MTTPAHVCVIGVELDNDARAYRRKLGMKLGTFASEISPW